MVLNFTRACYNYLPRPLDNILYGIFLNIVPIILNKKRVYDLGKFDMKLDLSESPMMVRRAFRTYEDTVSALISDRIDSGDTYVDIGSNKGYHTLETATIIGEDGRAYCFEPNPENIEDLQYNVELNGFEIDIYNKAMYSSNGTSKFTLGKKSGWGSVSDTGEIEVKLITFDGFLRNEGLNPREIDFVKIDVEGAEFEVIDGMHRFLRETNECTILIEIHSNAQKLKVKGKLINEGISPNEINGYMVIDV